MKYMILPLTSEGDISEAYALESELDTTKPSPKITKFLSEVNDACRESIVFLILEFKKSVKPLKIIEGTIFDLESKVEYPYSYLETMIELLINQDNL